MREKREDQIARITKLRGQGLTYEAIKERTGLSLSHISSILSGQFIKRNRKS